MAKPFVEQKKKQTNKETNQNPSILSYGRHILLKFRFKGLKLLLQHEN